MSKDYERIKAAGTPYDNLIRSAAESEGVRYELLHKQIYNESSFEPKAKSPTGPLGLAQFTEATGKAYGLMTPEDRMDPTKAVPAMARHMRELIDKYDGDELVAALAYNQGGGKLGAPQIAAMQAGDFSKISEEGRGYMAKLTDVAVSPHRDYFKGLKGGAPTISSRAGSLNLTAPASGRELSVGELAAIQGKPLSGDLEVGAWDGTGDASKAALATSVIGAAYRGYAEEGADLGTVIQMMRPVNRMQHNPMTEEDFETLDKLGVQPEYYRQFASAEREEWKHILPVVLDSQDYQQNFDSAGWAAQVTGGLVGAAGDPTSYVPVAGLTGSLGARVAKGAAYGVATAVTGDHLRSRVVGGESHLAASAAGGVILGGALSGVFGKNIVVTRGNDAAEHIQDPFTGPTIRAEARVRAAQDGSPDPTLMPHTDDTPTANVNGVDLQLVPFEEGAVRLPNGTILSGPNPLNPVTVARMEQFEQAAAGARMGGFTEIGHTLNRSENEAVREIGGQLFRPPTGTVSGSNGRFASTASDIVERERGQDHLSYQSLTNLADEAIGSKWYSALPGSRTEAQQILDRRAVEALEDPDRALVQALRPEERAYMDAVVSHTARKDDSLKNPSKYGNQNAVSLLDSTRYQGRYFPFVQDRAAKTLWTQALGGKDALQEVIIQAMLRSRPATMARVKAHVTDLLNAEGVPVTPQAIAQRVREYASGKAYGMSQDNALTAQAFDVNQGQFGGNVADNNFLKGRHLFDTDIRIDTPAGPFSINDLRDFSVGRILQAYDRRVNGDVAVMGSTGRTVGELEAQIKALPDDVKPDERAALDQALRVLTGQARRDTPEGALATVGRALNDTAFTLKSFFMPFQNFTEMAGLVSRGYVHMLGHNIPAYKELIAGKYKMTAGSLNDLHAGLFGRELDDSIRPARLDIVERLREQGSNEMVAQTVGSLKWATGAMARRSPAGYMLPETTNHLLDAGRKGILGDIVRHTVAGGKSPLDNLLISEPALLRSAGITPAQWGGIKDLINSSMVRDADGKYSVRDMAAFQADPRSMDLWRLADRMADEVVIRPHKVSNLDTKAYGVGVKMLMQFKSFLVKSLNERLLRGINEARLNGRVMDQTYTAALSALAGGSFYVSSAYLKAQMLPEHQRKKYLNDALDPNMIAYASLTRGSYLGTPFGLANIVAAPLGYDQAAMVRTSILPEAARKKDPKEKAWLYGLSDLDKPGEVFTDALKQVPAAGLLSSAAQVGYNLAGLAGTTNSPDMAQQYRTGIFNGFRGLVPNDPVSQRATVEMFERWGIDTTK
ncbi:transglycosylase SLT domain-containing protein [Pseudomonas sp. KCJK8993]|uniref:transglycosylase SLT domain-containing protein n=1 Tax=Pseudomonas sp. KCJK8993 TaxID=3344565 RepID=UPI0039068063